MSIKSTTPSKAGLASVMKTHATNISSQVGPQAERNMQWSNRSGELPPPPQREALMVESMADRRLYEQELARLRADAKFMEDQLQRTSKELRVYQLKYPQAAARIGRADLDAQPDVPGWVASAEVMSPLLAAYDGRIQDLEGLVESQRGELAALTERTEALVAENERLREGQVQDLDALVRVVQQTGADRGLHGAGAREMVDELNERISILMAENALMAEQTSVLSAELERTHAEACGAMRARVDSQEAQNASLSKALAEARAAVKGLEEQRFLRRRISRSAAFDPLTRTATATVPRLRSEKEHAESELMRHVNALADVETKLREISEGLAAAREEARGHAIAANELRKAMAELRRSSEAEAEQMAQRLQAGAARISELQASAHAFVDFTNGQFAAKAAEAEGAAEQARRVSRELERSSSSSSSSSTSSHDEKIQAAPFRNMRPPTLTVRADAEGMLQVMAGMEKQLAARAAKEAAVAQMEQEARQKVEEALMARDQAQALEVQARRELARVTEARRADGDARARETEAALATLREARKGRRRRARARETEAALATLSCELQGGCQARIAQGQRRRACAREMEAALATLRTRMAAQLEAREEEVRDLLAEGARLRVDADRCQRDRASAEALYASLKRAVDAEQASLKGRFDELSAKVLDAEARAQQHERAHREAQSALEDVKRALAAQHASARAKESQLGEALRARSAEVETMRSALRAAADAAERRERDAVRAALEAEETLSEVRRQLEHAEAERAAADEGWRARCASAEARAHEAARRAEDGDAARAKQLRAVKAQVSAEAADAKARLREESELAQRLSARNTDLQGRLSAAAAERAELVAAAAAAASEASHAAAQLAEAQRRARELGAQLAAALESQEGRAGDEARLRGELKRLQLELARTARQASERRLKRAAVRITRAAAAGNGRGGAAGRASRHGMRLPRSTLKREL
ncbi:hypothetical protein JKP88DRAFT_348798 [Tribonema minus]|uniref:Uncharacterized protein n=1 Tax=Tribonema minus TaxID=303371 RepID=A0A836CEA8_9STRA|nr:hypothetical protein JKP88DRAFT_348798 [Tribonema minus]